MLFQLEQDDVVLTKNKSNLSFHVFHGEVVILEGTYVVTFTALMKLQGDFSVYADKCLFSR